MAEHKPQTHSQAAENEAVLSWTVHLAAQNPTKLALSLTAVAFACAVAYWAIGPIGPIAVGAVMLGSLAEFLFPVRYEITESGAACRSIVKSTEMQWGKVRRCYLDDHGVKLSPLDDCTRLEAFRGVYLRFGGNSERVIEAVKSMRSKWCKESN